MEMCYLYGVQRNPLRSPLECKFQEGKDLSYLANCILCGQNDALHIVDIQC